jgi:hypothetical protein
MTAAMTPPANPEPYPEAADHYLADLLDECLQAEQAAPGSSAAIIQLAPPQVRADLARLLAVSQALQVRSSRPLGAARRLELRARIMARIDPPA